MKTRISPSLPNLPPVGASRGLLNLPNMPFRNWGVNQTQSPSLPSPPFTELAPIKHTHNVIELIPAFQILSMRFVGGGTKITNHGNKC